MHKIITLFKRDYKGNRQVFNEIVPGAAWVIAGEGVATIKIDGTCCLVRDGVLYKRYDAKKGKTPPANFEPAQPEPDETTGHWPGWIPVGNGPEDQWHREALKNWVKAYNGNTPDGTYELIGPKVQGNPHKHDVHILISHSSPVLVVAGPERNFESIRAWLAAQEVEGIVWHHPDGRMVKIKRRDFGLPWGRK